jgi:hypothetical protein
VIPTGRTSSLRTVIHETHDDRVLVFGAPRPLVLEKTSGGGSPDVSRSIEERRFRCLIILRRAKPESVNCPHCGAPNPPGRERCEVCGRELAVKEFVPCPNCSSITDPELRAACTRCKGRGFLEAPQPVDGQKPAKEP